MNLKQKLLKIVANLLNHLQKKIDKKYEKEGLTEKVLKAQLYVNKVRNEYNIPDPSEMIYEDFVQ